jgi:hypothetical protein
MSAVTSAIAERYSTAIETSSLQLHHDGSGQVAVIYAAGCARRSKDGPQSQSGMRNNLGALLLRLHSEFDGVRERVAHARVRVSDLKFGATLLRRAAKPHRGKPEPASQLAADKLERLAKSVDKEADAYAASELALALMHLKSLREVREALGRYAVIEATKRRVMLDDETVLKLAGAVLEVHLTPQCHPCEGRGMVGVIYKGEAQSVCRSCNGSGKRRPQIGKNEAQWQFAAWLQAELEEVLTNSTARIRRHLR